MPASYAAFAQQTDTLSALQMTSLVDCNLTANDTASEVFVSPADSPTHSSQPKSIPPRRKPRTWTTAIKRHASSLTSQFLQTRTPANKPLLATQAEFRRSFLKSSRDRLLKDCKGNCFRMYPMIMNGDCGFASIAKAINIAREKINSQSPPPRFYWRISFPWRRSTNASQSKRPLQPKDVRMAMFAEIRKAKKTYLADKQYESFYNEDDLDRLIERLEREVSRQGIGGHWLGTVLDQLEYIIVAHAMNINIYLYQFDLKSQTVVQFDEAVVPNAHCDVYLLFTGPPGSGHFDTLVKVPDNTPSHDLNQSAPRTGITTANAISANRTVIADDAATVMTQ